MSRFPAKINKNCCVRLPEDLHRRVKLAAYESGHTLQNWIISILIDALIESRYSNKKYELK